MGGFVVDDFLNRFFRFGSSSTELSVRFSSKSSVVLSIDAVEVEVKREEEGEAHSMATSSTFEWWFCWSFSVELFKRFVLSSPAVKSILVVLVASEEAPLMATASVVTLGTVAATFLTENLYSSCEFPKQLLKINRNEYFSIEQKTYAFEFHATI